MFKKLKKGFENTCKKDYIEYILVSIFSAICVFIVLDLLQQSLCLNILISVIIFLVIFLSNVYLIGSILLIRPLKDYE